MRDENTDPDESGAAADGDSASIGEGMLLDNVSGNPIKDSPVEQVRQKRIRALFHEYGISVEDMAIDFKMPVNKKQKKVDLVIFATGQPRIVDNIRRIVVCQKEPTTGRKGAYKMRSHEQAKKDFEFLHAAMTEAKNCQHGWWSIGLA